MFFCTSEATSNAFSSHKVVSIGTITWQVSFCGEETCDDIAQKSRDGNSTSLVAGSNMVAHNCHIYFIEGISKLKKWWSGKKLESIYKLFEMSGSMLFMKAYISLQYLVVFSTWLRAFIL